MADSHWGRDWAILDDGNADKTERRSDVCSVRHLYCLSLQGVGYEHSSLKYAVAFI